MGEHGGIEEMSEIMSETEKIRFIGYNLNGEKWDLTITGVYERATAEVDLKLSTVDKLRYDHIFLAKVHDPMKTINAKKVRLSLSTEGIFHEMTILLQGIAYVMNQNGDTVDVIKTKREDV